MSLDPVLLSRIQFAFTITFHIIFPTLSIGLSLFLAIAEGVWLKTKNELWLRIFRFWVVIFAMGFGVGVVTGIVLDFEIGTNFGRFAQIAGAVVGPLIAFEVLTAFFLEAGFLGIMLFGMGRVGPKTHYFATCMVALGTTLSASWILATNSWMQTPAGYVLDHGRFVVTDWWQVIFNPSYLYRMPHMLVAAYLTSAFLIAGVAAIYLLRQRHLEFARATFRFGLGAAGVLIIVQVFLGDLLYGMMIEHQPSKMQAAEGFWDRQSESPAPYFWIVVPDQAHERNRFELGTPYLGSIWLTHSLTGRVAGLKNTPPDRRPLMTPVFYGFRVMYVTAILMFATSVTALYLHLRRRLYTTRWFQRICAAMTPAGFLAVIGGWYLAETGRQPYVVFGLLPTADAVSPVAAQAVLATFTVFVCVYAVFLTAFLVFTVKHIRRGPTDLPAASPYSGSIKRVFMTVTPKPVGAREG